MRSTHRTPSPDLDVMAFGQLVIALRCDRLVCVAVTPPTWRGRAHGGGHGDNAAPIISWAGDQ